MAPRPLLGLYPRGMKRDDLVCWLNTYLAIDTFDDSSFNGLQVEGRDEVVKVAVAVDASLHTFEQAAELGADLLIVHHGLFWGVQKAVRGMHRSRVKFLLDTDISLYAAHIPLDAHREVGNNWGLARILGLGGLEDFGHYRGLPVGVKGAFTDGIDRRELADRVERELSREVGRGESVLVHAGGPQVVQTMGIISGGAAWDVVTAAEEDLDCFLTGEPKHEVFHEAFERGINVIYAGHYMTETVGVNLLAERLRDRFDLKTEFILHSTGL